MRPSAGAPARCIVSTDWLASHIGEAGFVVLDIRAEQDYAAGHIPGSVNSPFNRWTTTHAGLILELPSRSDLFCAIGQAGIVSASTVVVVGEADNPYALADAACVADRLIYGRVQNVTVLDGGYDKWCHETRAVDRESAKPMVREYQSDTDETMFVSKDQVKQSIGNSILIDARDPSVYFGIVKEPTAQKAGHIPGARCLPAPWIWNANGTYRDAAELRKAAEGVVGTDSGREIIVYCGVGGYAGAWWFVLSRVLGYRSVKIYNGSAQEWTMDPGAEVVCFRWE